MSSSSTTLITHGLLRPYRIPIHVPFTISRESLPLAEVLIVSLHDSEGRRGLGEAAPFPSLTFDSLPDAQNVAEMLLSELPDMTLDQALSHLRARKADLTPKSITGFVAVECALYDLLAQSQNRPLAALFGGPKQQSLMTDITLPIMPVAEISGFLDLYRAHDFSTIKVKVSGNVSQDIEMLEGLQAQIPPQTPLILDGNQGFSPSGAQKLVATCLERNMNLLFFEQPLSEQDKEGLAFLLRALPLPVCVDESVRSHKDLQDLLRVGLRPIVNIKIMKSGVEEAIRIIQLANKASCPLMIGGMLESEIAMTFSLQIACGTGVISYADLDTPFFFKERLTTESPWHTASAELQLPSAIGLGLELRDIS